MQFNQTDLDSAVAQLAMCEFFPKESATQAAIMEFLAKICPHRAALDWLVNTMVNQVGRWHGPSELKGVLCSRYRPADGLEITCRQTPGFTPAALEMAALENQNRQSYGYLETRVNAPQLEGSVEKESAQLVTLGLNPKAKTLLRPRATDLRAAAEFAKRVDA